jgi:hypothetical protein
VHQVPNYLTPDFGTELERTRSEDETGYVAVTFHPSHGGILVTVGEDHEGRSFADVDELMSDLVPALKYLESVAKSEAQFEAERDTDELGGEG